MFNAKPRALIFSFLCFYGLSPVLHASNASSNSGTNSLLIKKIDYQQKVYASWVGQMIGNFYGLSYEFKYIDEPGPNKFPYGYGQSLERIKEVNGAFSDDDTDIEYMYLLAMEQHGITPTYKQLSKHWRHQVREKVWAANRAAVTLMHAGFTPPLTGNKNYNSEWFQIDPQLVNEIWAVTSPGMINYAKNKTAWAAKITNDSFGIEPAVHYGAMYAAAFFESDINTLIDIGNAAIGDDAKFTKTVAHMRQLYKRYPNDWRLARKEMADTYAKTFDYNVNSWVAIDANLNGACAILALLYGEGDFQKTLDMASAIGFDADNQAATLSGLLGITLGLEGIPDNLLYPIQDKGWSKPFNDKYINVSRHDLPDASIEDMAKRIAQQGENIILANGGKLINKNGVDYYQVNPNADFTAPVELPNSPPLLAEINQPFEFDFLPSNNQASQFAVVAGLLPQGLELIDHSIKGVAKVTGTFSVTIEMKQANAVTKQTYQLRVHSQNLSSLATEVIFNHQERQARQGQEESATQTNIELIRDNKFGLKDGLTDGKTFYSEGTLQSGRIDFYGYQWQQPQQISTLIFNPGYTTEYTGWFTSLNVEYLNGAGQWQAVQGLDILPKMNFDNDKYLKGKYINHSLSFVPVTTKGIRIIGGAGGVQPDDKTQPRLFSTSISELSVYQK